MGRKFIMLISGFILLFTLAACTESTQQKEKNEEIDQISIKDQPPKDDSDDATTSEDEEEEMDSVKEEAEKEDIDDVSKDSFAAYTEGATITQEVDINGLMPDIQTDNDHKRIMLLTSDNQQVVYKTIYLKKKKTLKIIDVKNDNGQIFYGTI